MTDTFGALIGAEILERREAAGMTQRELAEEAFDDPDKIDTIERRIRELESATPPANPRAKTYQPLCETLSITRDDIRAMKAQAANRREQADTEREELREDIGPLPAALNDPSGLSRNQLIALAELFGADAPEDQPDTALRGFITEKAEEYVTYRATIDALDDRVAAIANLKGAAQHAADTLNFEEVETLLARVDEVETEIAADTKVARARNALMRGEEQQAFQILSAAADSFASIDPLEPARKRILDYFTILRDHGLRYGGHGLRLSNDLISPVLTDTLLDADSPLWAAGQNALAIAFRNQGIRTDGSAGADLLEKAVTAYRAALDVRTRAAHPVDWAMTQNNLGNALNDQGSRTEGPAGADLLKQAVTAYRAALDVRTRTAHPVNWAMTQNNLGNALRNQGIRTDGPAGADLLAQAVTAFRAALDVYTRTEHPEDWAMTQNNLGNALGDQGARTEGSAGADLLAQAVAAYRSALDVRTRTEHPVAWATTQNNLAVALRNQGSQTDGPAGADLLAQAITAYRAALDVRTRKEQQVDWAMTQENIAIAHVARAEHNSTQDPRPDLDAALAAVILALEVFDPVYMSYNHTKATRLRDYIQAALDALPPE